MRKDGEVGMTDREKTIKGLGCLADENSACHSDCPYFTDREEGGFCFRKMAHDALDLLKEQPAKDTNVPSKWISVKKKLPENTDTVLIAHKGGVSFGWYNGRYWERGANTNHRPLETVTHWMPLPEPPEE